MTEPSGPDPVVEAYKKNLDRSLIRQNLQRSIQERLEALMELQALRGRAAALGSPHPDAMTDFEGRLEQR